MIFARFRKESLLCAFLAYWMIHLPALDAKVRGITIMVPIDPPETCDMGRASISGDGSCCAERASLPVPCCTCFSVNDLNPLPESDFSLSPALPLLWVISPPEVTRSDRDIQPPIPPPERVLLS